MALKLASKFIGSIFFSIAALIFFMSFFANSLLTNFDVFESTLKQNFSESDIIVAQLAEKTGLQPSEVRSLCSKNPEEEMCNFVNDPSLALESFNFNEIKQKILSIKPYISKVFSASIFLLIVSLVFYFLGTFSLYSTLFWIFINALISSVSGFIIFDSMPSFIPSMLNTAMPSEVPLELKSILENALVSWFKASLNSLNSLFTLLIAVSIVFSIIFYFLKKK